MKVEVLEAVGHYGGKPLVVGEQLEVADDKGARMIAAGVAKVVTAKKEKAAK